MIRAYFPGQAVAPWLERIEIDEDAPPNAICHGGIGLIYRLRGAFHVWRIAGPFMRVRYSVRNVTIVGQGSGVYIYSSFINWLCRASDAI